MLQRYRKFETVAEDPNVPAKDRIVAQIMNVDTVVDILRLECEGPTLEQIKQSEETMMLKSSDDKDKS